MAEGRTPALSHGSGEEAGNPLRGIPDQGIREELNRVLASHEFRSSRRCQDFIRYVVETTLHGHTETLKERTIGIDVFGRPESYDPSDDATVRVKAGEVRKRLGLYYAGEGHQNEIRIELPGGTYIPEFHRREVAAVAEAPPVVVPKKRTFGRLLVALLALAAVCAAAVIVWLRAGASDSAIDQFWAPVFKGSAPVLLSAAYTPDVYAFDRETQQYVLLTDQFVGGGDLLAVSQLSSMLQNMHRAYQVRIGTDVSFHDLRTAPAVLIGYSYTRWKEISRELRFFIDADRKPLMVTDNGAPTQWSLPALRTDRHTNEDYAIVSRVFHPETRAMLVEVAGITQYGTDAAAELVTKADLMADAFRNAPAGWQKKNLQIVIHVKVISGTPASQKVVATHFW